MPSEDPTLEGEAAVAREYEATMRVEDEARAKLAQTLEKLVAELSRWRREAALQKSRAEGVEQSLERRSAMLADVKKRYDELAGKSSDFMGMKMQIDGERDKLLAEVQKAMKTAEDIRREGIEALEQARLLKKKATSGPPASPSS